MLDQVKQLNSEYGREILRLATAETEDAIEVLSEGQIIANPEALALLKEAQSLEIKARRRKVSRSIRNRLINRAINLKIDANDSLLSPA